MNRPIPLSAFARLVVMLKSIEICGFKSFADRARLEFDEGVCALVGPNGSGKSNIVDAIKWTLGEQSAKRLRGDEMTDVIFNGSSTRQGLGSAEATLTFDNAKRLLAIDADEISLTRRVYRNGDAEYLINGRAARLKDFRDLVGAVGLGAQCYAVIEQGRVEALLQSSSAQRRAVLEEAAGVSRFNAKKQEVLRRLERVEQNLLRLSDLVGEIESQLRKTKSQAGKAETYRRLSARLQKLRLETSLYERRVKQEALRVASEQTDDFAAFESRQTSEIARAETSQAQRATEVAAAEARLRDAESELGAARERIAADESTIEIRVGQIREWTRSLVSLARQSYETTIKRRETLAAESQARAELEEVERGAASTSSAFATENAAVETLAQRASELVRARDELQRSRETSAADASRFVGELSGLEARARSLESSRAQKASQLADATRRQTELSGEVARLHDDGQELDKRREEISGRLATLNARRDELRATLERRQSDFSELERKRATYEERSALLNDLLRKYDGLSPGVKETLKAMKDGASPFRNAYGLVADLIRVNVEAAPLVELALGQTAQYVVVPPEPELFRHIERQGARFAGRVGFIWLDPHPGKPIPLDPNLDGRPGVLGRADQFVETEPMFAPLIQRLLYRTWIVESVAAAKQLYREVSEPTNFLAADGSLLTADATLVVGAAQGGAGLISRRSELAALSNETARLEKDYAELSAVLAQLNAELADVDAACERESNALLETSRALETLRLQRTASEERDAQLSSRVAQLTAESAELDAEFQTTSEELAAKRRAKEEFDAALAKLDDQLDAAQRELDAVDAERQDRAKRSTNLKIELAKAEERVLFLKDGLKRFADALAEQSRRMTECESSLAATRERCERTELEALQIEASLATQYARKERAVVDARALAKERAKLTKLRAQATSELKTLRETLEKRRADVRAQELSRERSLQELNSLESRVRDDYGVDLATLEFLEEDALANVEVDAETLVVPTTEKSAQARRKEIEELRVKLRELGSVNLEAIETLETLKTRYSTLFNQYNDLIAARKSIRKILDRVNGDCKRLFEETLAAVRENFNEIFQKLFGGGRADLVLENPSAPLESGVEITARPPGKDLKSLTLMSGGEKSLTCAALLLAIFRYRPSPLCVLDEVDAALDEANVHRFVNALQDFIPTTQFLIVTHSKKTMSSAKTIYGVTMEDSGVSKILSVHFDDVGEDGEILVSGTTKNGTLRLSSN